MKTRENASHSVVRIITVSTPPSFPVSVLPLYKYDFLPVMGFGEFKKTQSFHKHFVIFISSLFGNSSILSETAEARTIQLVLLYVRWLLQMLLFIESSGSSSSAAIDWFWFALSCTRPDSLLSNVSAAHVWFLVVCIAVVFAWVLFVTLLAMSWWEVTEWKTGKIVLLFLTNSLVFVFSIPCSNGLMSVWFTDQRFSAGFSPSIRYWGQWFSVPLYLAYLAYTLIVYIGNYEFDMYDRNKMSKSELMQDYLYLLLTQVTIWSYYLFQSNNYEMNLIVVGLGAMTATWRQFTHLSFYKEVHNLMFVWSRGAMGLSCVGFLIGHWLNSPLCGVLLMFTLSVSWFIVLQLWFEQYCKRRTKRYSTQLQEDIDDYQWELGLRKSIRKAYFSPSDEQRKESGKEVLDVINWSLSCPSRKNNVKALLIKHFILLRVFENERAARVCLSLANVYKGSKEEQFLLIKHESDLSAKSNLEEVRFFRYLEKVIEMQAKDTEICHLLETIWKELGSVRPDSDRVVCHSQVVRHNIKTVNEEYSKVAKTYPGSFSLYDFYSSFLDEVCNDTDHANYWRTKALAALRDEKRSKDDKAGFFDGSSGVILVDIRPENIGGILYMNGMAGQILQYDLKDITSSKITGIIPPPFNAVHGKCIRNFVKSGTNVEFDHPSFMPLLAASGYIIFCTTQILLTCHNGFPMIALAFKPLKSLQDGALISPSLTIESHSSGLSAYLEVDMPNLKGKNIDEIRPSFARYRSIDGHSSAFTLYTNRKFIGQFSYLLFAGRKVCFFFVFKTGK